MAKRTIPTWMAVTGILGASLLPIAAAVAMVLLAAMMSVFRTPQPAPYGHYVAPAAYQQPGQPFDAYRADGGFRGEAEIGGMPMVSGTMDPSGQGNHVISVDGEVLDLPF